MYLEFDLAGPVPTQTTINADRRLAYVTLLAKFLLPALVMWVVSGFGLSMLTLALPCMIWAEKEIDQLQLLKERTGGWTETTAMASIMLAKRLQEYCPTSDSLRLESYCKTIQEQQRPLVYAEYKMIAAMHSNILTQLACLAYVHAKPAAAEAVTATAEQIKAPEPLAQKPVFGLTNH